MGRFKILVVDDEPIVLDSCKLILEAEDYDVELVPSVDEAVEALKKSDFGLLLVDVKMPVRDGMSLMREVKENWPEMPIVVMSGYPTRETVAAVAEIGASKFIPKPFTPDELCEIVRQFTQKEESNGNKKGSGN
jgi:DNA-binding NtrC family response regulator